VRRDRLRDTLRTRYYRDGGAVRSDPAALDDEEAIGLASCSSATSTAAW
jgi:hypothetical protein